MSCAAVRSTAVRWLLSADECAHELPLNHWPDLLQVDALVGQKRQRILGTVDPGRLDPDTLESGSRELRPVLALVQCTGNTADPEEHILPDLFRNIAARHHVGNGEPAAW